MPELPFKQDLNAPSSGNGPTLQAHLNTLSQKSNIPSGTKSRQNISRRIPDNRSTRTQQPGNLAKKNDRNYARSSQDPPRGVGLISKTKSNQRLVNDDLAGVKSTRSSQNPMNIGAKKTPQPFSRKSSKGALLSRQNKRTPAPIDQDLLPASSRQSSALMQ